MEEGRVDARWLRETAGSTKIPARVLRADAVAEAKCRGRSIPVRGRHVVGLRRRVAARVLTYNNSADYARTISRTPTEYAD